jgi:hypothetical protein
MNQTDSSSFIIRDGGFKTSPHYTTNPENAVGQMVQLHDTKILRARSYK